MSYSVRLLPFWKQKFATLYHDSLIFIVVLFLCKSLRSRKPFVLAKPSNFRMHSRHHCLLIAINKNNHEALTFWKSIDKNNNTYEPPWPSLSYSNNYINSTHSSSWNRCNVMEWVRCTDIIMIWCFQVKLHNSLRLMINMVDDMFVKNKFSKYPL